MKNRKKYTEIVLIRHAKTDYNLQERYCSNTDLSLNKKGIKQAETLRDEICGLSPSLIFCSPLKRTQQTASILFSNSEQIIDARLKELNFGRWEGLNFQEIIANNGALYQRWLNNPFKFSPPQGETLRQLQRRCLKFIEAVFRNYQGEKIVIVSHAGPIRIITLNLLSKRKEEFWQDSVATASVSYFKFNKDKLKEYLINQKWED